MVVIELAMPNVELDVYKYQISNVLLSSPMWGDKVITIDKSLVRSVTVKNNYEQEIIPNMEMECQVPYDDYYEILSATKSVIASFTISCANFGAQNNVTERSAENETDRNEASYNSEWVSCNMQVFDQGYLYSRDVVDTSIDTENTEAAESAKTAKLFSIKFYMIDVNKVKKVRDNQSYIINGNKNDVLYELFRSRNMDSLLIAPTTGEERTDYAIPYGDLVQNIYSFNDFYGIYESDYILYMGLDRTYMIPKMDMGSTLEYGELSTVNIYIVQYDSEEKVPNVGCHKDASKKIYILGTADAQIDNVDSLIDFTSGDSITAVESGTKNIYHASIGDKGIERAYKISNPLGISQLKNSLLENKRNLVVTFKDIDLSIITPNKKYVIDADARYFDKSYDISGIYRLIASNIVFSNNGGGFNVNVTISLNKIN